MLNASEQGYVMTFSDTYHQTKQSMVKCWEVAFLLVFNLCFAEYNH